MTAGTLDSFFPIHCLQEAGLQEGERDHERMAMQASPRSALEMVGPQGESASMNGPVPALSRGPEHMTPADAYFGRTPAIIKQRERIKQKTIEHWGLQHRKFTT